MADERTASRPFSAAGVNGRRARCRRATSRDHERLHAHREILRQGVLGEHVGLSEHGSQSNLLAR